jgi:head-tail adaptor
MLPSVDELNQMRVSIEELTLPDVCNVLSLTRTADGQGGWTEAWGTAIASVACRLDARGGREALSADAIQPFSQWMLTLAHDVTVTAQNRIEHGGYTYNVVSLNTDASWQACKRVLLELA